MFGIEVVSSWLQTFSSLLRCGNSYNKVYLFAGTGWKDLAYQNTLHSIGAWGIFSVYLEWNNSEVFGHLHMVIAQAT